MGVRGEIDDGVALVGETGQVILPQPVTNFPLPNCRTYRIVDSVITGRSFKGFKIALLAEPNRMIILTAVIDTQKKTGRVVAFVCQTIQGQLPPAANRLKNRFYN